MKEKFNCLSLFSGIGGFDLAAQWAGVKTTQFVEIDPFCQKVLEKNFPGVKIHDDIATFTANRGEFDFITFGSPCQDFSEAGKREGIQGDRSSLFFHAARLIEEVRPLGFIMENVRGINYWLPLVLYRLTQIGGYHLFWFTLSAAKLGGCHIRDRWFCVGARSSLPANSLGKQPPERSPRTLQAEAGEKAEQESWTLCQQERLQTLAGIYRKNDGATFGMDRSRLMDREEAWRLINEGKSCDRRDLPNRNKRMKPLGNAVTPQQAYIAWLMLFELISVKGSQSSDRQLD